MLTGTTPVYQNIPIKFFERFLHIAKAMTKIASEGIGLWDGETEFYYDVQCLPDGQQRVWHRLDGLFQALTGGIRLPSETAPLRLLKSTECLGNFGAFGERVGGPGAGRVFVNAST